ncbi:MAG: PKD domain-containing protein [Silvibacterium sp.]
MTQSRELRQRRIGLGADWALLKIGAVATILCLAQLAHAADTTLRIRQEFVTVHSSDGSYEIGQENRSVIHARVAVRVDHNWVTSSDYPQHQVTESSFGDTLGHGREVTVQCTGFPSRPELSYVIRLYDNMDAGDIRVEVQNHTGQSATVQSIRSVEAIGDRPLNTGAAESNDRVLSDSFSEDWPPLKIYDLGQAPAGMLRAVGSQLIYNRQSKESIFFGALSSDRFLTIMHLKVNSDTPHSSEIASYTVDSSGTTEIQASDPESGLRGGPVKNLVELSLPVSPGAAIDSERLMFALGNNYYSILDTYGNAIRLLHHSRSGTGPMLGWWSWTAFYSDITEGNSWSNAQWLAEHLKHLGFNYFHLDLGYAYARGEYTTPNAAQFPNGLAPLSHKVCNLGLKMGFWTAPFEASDRSWVYEHHKDWLVHNAQGEPIQIGVGDEAGKEVLFVLDATNPAAQQYLRDTYRTLARDWGAAYIKLDFMDNTAIEGYYYAPNTTALEAQRIGLRIIREAVGEHVLLDKDGSPMLNPVGLVDEGRLSQDTGHSFLRSKEAAPGIAARYYMQHNFFLSDPDALTVSRQMIEERHIQAPLTLNEAQVSVALAAVSGGMFEIGDDLPTLGRDPDRVALVTNPDLLQMVKLGKAALPLDLLTYRHEDEQPGIFLLREDSRQAMLAVFNWTEHPNSHTLSFSDLALSPGHHYRVVDVFRPEQQLAFDSTGLRINNQPAHSVTLLKILDESIAAQPPSITAQVPTTGKVGEDLGFAAAASKNSVPALAYHWDFGDGVLTDGTTVTHTYTYAGSFRVHLRIEGVDGVSFEKNHPVTISDSMPVPTPKRFLVDNGKM